VADDLIDRFGGDTLRQLREHFSLTTGRVRDRVRRRPAAAARSRVE
jgi:hypothetical protein